MGKEIRVGGSEGNTNLWRIYTPKNVWDGKNLNLISLMLSVNISCKRSAFVATSCSN